MENLKLFCHSDFGSLSVLTVGDDKILFPATECAEMLGYINPRDAIARHCKTEGVVKHDSPTDGGIQSKNYITEGNLYRLIVHSNLPAAERFERWIFDEVLPTVRTGSELQARTTVRYPAELSYGTGTELSSELWAEQIKCTCGGVPELSHNRYWYRLECPLCGRAVGGVPTVRDAVEYWCNEIDFELWNFEWFNIRDYGDMKKLITGYGADGLVSLCNSLGVQVVYYPESIQHGREEYARCINISGNPHILVRKDLEKDHKRAVTALMLGYIFLNYITYAREGRYIMSTESNPLDREKSVCIFAYMLLSAMGYTESLKYITNASERKKKHDTITGERALEVREA